MCEQRPPASASCNSINSIDKISDLSESIPSKAMFAEQQRWRQGAGHPEALQRTFDKVPFGRLGHRSQIRWFWTKRDLMIWEDV